MNAILGYSEMLLEDETPEPRPRPTSRSIQTAGRTLLALINEILDPARAGRAAIRRSDLEVAGARIRHDLRTPVERDPRLQRDAHRRRAGLRAGDCLDDLKRIHGAGQKLLAVIDDIVRLSSAEVRSGVTGESATRASRS